MKPLALLIFLICSTLFASEIPDASPPPFKNTWEITKDYEANEVAADLVYKHHSFIIKGRIADFKSSDAGPLLVLMEGFVCEFPPEAAVALAKFSKGDSIRIYGCITGRELSQIIMKHCLLRP